MIRVVADTNVFVSAFQFGGLPEKFLELMLAGSFQLIISEPLLDELDATLRVKFHRTHEDLKSIQITLTNVADIVAPSMEIDVIKDDPDDNRVLECAIEGVADFIVSGDRHLLTLGSYQSIQILTVRQFLDHVAA